MKVVNVHQRLLQARPEQVGALIDSLASATDALWPKHDWPRMKFDRELGAGARGGHGPVGYRVETYRPGRMIQFRFTRPRGFDGFHRFEYHAQGPDTCVLGHRLEMQTRGLAIVSWPLFFRPLHDALVEDSLTTAENSLELPRHVQPWSWRVRLLRWVVSGGKAGPQTIAGAGRNEPIQRHG
jgi:hypothetical protein